jgi:large subunit ribosomal protein L13
MNTFMQKKESVVRQWHVIDATGTPLGRLASEAASLIKGKHKPTFTPHVDGGDYVIVINADQFVFTGNKENTKLYQKHSGWIGGLKTRTAKEMKEKFPAKVIELAVHGMLPKSKLGSVMKTRLYVYKDSTHPHSAQLPQPYTVKG